MAFVTSAIALGNAIFATVGLATSSLALLAGTGFLAQAALGLALNALTPKPKLPGLGSSRGYNVTQRGSALSHQIVYGEVKVAGAIVYDGATGNNNKFLHRVIALTGHEIESFERVWINDSYVDVADIDASSSFTYSGTYSTGSVVQTVFSDATISEDFAIGIYTPFTTPSVSTVATALGLPSTPISLRITSKTTNTVGNISSVTDPDGSTSSRYNGKLRINFHLGSPDQTADADLVSEVPEWTSNHRLRGVSYIYCRFTFDQDAYPNGVPEVQVTIKGKKVYDPRSDTTVWSDNPALCLRDYLTSSYGLAEAEANIDDDLVTTAANVCDQTDTEAGTKRYTCNGSFTTDTTPYDLLSAMLTSMGGLLWYAQGEWRMKPAYWVAPTTSLNEDDLRSSISVNTRHSRRDNFNTVRGTFRGAESNWQITDYPDVTNSAFLAPDGGRESVADIDLPFTDNSIEARRIGRIALERNRQQLTVQASFGLRAFPLQVGDTVNLTVSRFGWTNKEFEVVAWTFGIVDSMDLQVSLTLRETAESIFDEVDDGVVYERDNTSLLSPFEVPSVGVNAEAVTQVIREKLTNIINVTVSSGRPEAVDRVEVEFKNSADEDYTSLGTGDLGLFRAVDLDTGTYDFRARAVNSFGVKGEWEYLFGIAANGLLDPPSDVTGFTAEVNGPSVHLEWTPVPDLDLSYYRIRYSVEESGSTYANASTAVDKVPRPANSVSVPTRPGTYHIKAIDKSGVGSENYTSVVVPTASLESFANTDTQTEDPTFSGTIAKYSGATTVYAENNLSPDFVLDFENATYLGGDSAVVVSSSLRIANPEVAPSSATYDFSDYIDTGAARLVRSRVDYVTARVDNSSGLWDDIPGLFEDFPGLFDDFTGAVQFADTNVQTYISITQDDPTGTPTWTNYQLFRAGDYFGRAFRFRVVLTSTSDNVTPSITQLDAIVEYN